MLRHAIGMLEIVALSGCGGVGSMSVGSLNPFSWGKSDVQADQQERIAAARTTLASFDDGRPLMPSVDFVSADRSPMGVILRASGQSPSLGYHSAGLRPLLSTRPDEDGVLLFELVAFPPEASPGPGTAATRQIEVATYLPNSRLRGVRSIVVVSAGGERSVRLR